MFYGSSKFKPLTGWDELQQNSGLCNLGVSSIQTAPRGLLLAYGDDDQDLVACTNGKKFAGFLGQTVDTTGLTILNFAVTQNKDFPLRDTIDYVTAWAPQPGALAEFEGSGAAMLTNLVVTSGGTAAGAITSGAVAGSMLSCSAGSLRLAITGDRPLFELISVLTAENAGHVRILAKYQPGQTLVA